MLTNSNTIMNMNRSLKASKMTLHFYLSQIARYQEIANGLIRHGDNATETFGVICVYQRLALGCK